MKILIVDDDPIILETLSRILTADGFEVITASDGVKAFDLLEEKKIDMVISDIMMPNMSGLGLLKILKEHYLKRIPVILISSLDKCEIILSALKMGADDFVLKPVNFLELKIRIEKQINAKARVFQDK
ncbi:MAG: response regulator [Bacteroidetes bacterium]|nr:response regulator [Bacteroidota bacterium]HET6244317.1 response regulator [Bacteroidia bacterium]